MPLYKPMQNTRIFLSVSQLWGQVDISWPALPSSLQVLFSLSLSLSPEVLKLCIHEFCDWVVHGMFKISTSFKGNK